jgi:hypothetical protein
VPADASRAERIASNEALFRDLNAELERGLPSLQRDAEELAAFVCECGSAGCSQMVKLPLDAYQRAHEADDHFVVLPGHERPKVEDVVDEHDEWLVVEKKDIGEVKDIVDRG